MVSETLAHDLSRTLALSNHYLMLLVESCGLKGLAASHGDILAALFAEGEMAMSELSRRIGRDPSTVTALVKKLVAMGLAQTAKSPCDRRSTMVSLTERGLALQHDFDRISERLAAVWRTGIDPADLATAYRVLAAVQGNLRAAIGNEQAELLRRQA